MPEQKLAQREPEPLDSRNRYWRTRDAAQYLGLSPSTLGVFRFQKRGPKYYLLEKSIRYLKEDLDAWAKPADVNADARPKSVSLNVGRRAKAKPTRPRLKAVK